jgi:HK97 family phage prohead protease
MKFDNPGSVTFKVNAETRTLRGLALPFGVAARDSSGGGPWLFDADSDLTWTRAKLLDGHDWRSLVGTSGFAKTDEGLEFAAKVARTAKGDEILTLAMADEDDPDAGAALDGVSVGFANEGFEFEARDGHYYVKAGHITELSVTPIPAFAGAQIRSVAASAAPTDEGNPMTDQTTEVAEAQFTALGTKVTELAQKVEQLADIKVPVATATFEVKEEPIYRFSGHTPAPSGFDFATDMLAAANGDGAALARVREFTAERLGPQFVDTTDTASVNPSQYRPDMFLGQAPVPASPMYDFFRKGSLTDVTPFFHTKLDRTSTTVAVGNHTEGVEPTDTELVTATGATVTPAPVSGKVHITREVADQGGNPQVSALVWAEFERSYKIALETKTTALIAAAAASITSLTTAIAAGADGATAGAAIERGLLGLQFLADGSRFEKAFGHVDLYTALATYENADGEKRYPIINPQNRDGVTGAKYSFIDIAGYRMEPGTSLGATSTAASNSYVADPNAVHVWNSGLQRLEKLQEKVEGWDLGVFGYFAGLVYDVTGLRKISYDPTV